MSGITRKPRLPDGTYGELEAVFGGETQTETIARLTKENEELKESNLAAFMAIAEVFEILEGGA